MDDRLAPLRERQGDWAYFWPVNVRIVGTPAPQGSKVHIRNGVMRESSRRLPAWRGAVMSAAKAVADQRGTIDVPVIVFAAFDLRRPARTKYPDWPVGRNTGDLDKLQRALGDGLEHGGLILDDRLIIEWHASKRWAAQGTPPGAYVQIYHADLTVGGGVVCGDAGPV